MSDVCLGRRSNACYRGLFGEAPALGKVDPPQSYEQTFMNKQRRLAEIRSRTSVEYLTASSQNLNFVSSATSSRDAKALLALKQLEG